MSVYSHADRIIYVYVQRRSSFLQNVSAYIDNIALIKRFFPENTRSFHDVVCLSSYICDNIKKSTSMRAKISKTYFSFRQI